MSECRPDNFDVAATGTTRLEDAAVHMTREVHHRAPHITAGPHPDTSNLWGHFLSHGVACMTCRTGQLCPTGRTLHRTAQRNARAGERLLSRDEHIEA